MTSILLQHRCCECATHSANPHRKLPTTRRPNPFWLRGLIDRGWSATPPSVVGAKLALADIGRQAVVTRLTRLAARLEPRLR